MGVFTTGKTNLIGLFLKNPWWLSGASIDLDFDNGRYYDSSLASGKQSLATVTNYLSISRASTGYAKTSAGTLTNFATDTLRITDLGLLVEDARTNLVLGSEDFTSGGWTPSNVTLTTNAATAPNGQTAANKITPNTSNAVHYHNTGYGDVTVATTTVSIFAKAAGYNFLRIAEQSVNGAWFNLGTGAVGTVDSGITASIEAYGNGWYRCIITYTSSTVDNSYFYACNADNVVSFAGDGTSGIYLWGPQYEKSAAFPSSYIPTAGASATRAADSIQLAGAPKSAMQAATASVLLDTGPLKESDFAGDRSYHLKFASDNRSIRYFATTQFTLRDAAANDIFANLPGGQSSLVDNLKTGAAWDGSGRSAVANGGTVATDSTAMGSDSNDVYFCCSDSSNNSLNNYCRRATFWTTRLADATLQALTAP